MKRWFCEANSLNHRALQKASDIHSQLLSAAKEQGLTADSCTRETKPIRRSLTAGFFIQAARLQPDRNYCTMAGKRIANLHPSSALFGSSPRPEHVIYNEIVYTTKLYLRDVVAIDSAWLAEVAPRFYQRSEGAVTSNSHTFA